MFNSVSDDIFKKLVTKMTCKSCELDFIPIKIIKEHLDKFSPLLSLIVNRSLNEACFPDTWKIAVVRPLIKKCNHGKTDKNYRPVSSLLFISQLIEKAVLYQLHKHCTYNDIHSAFQSAYSCQTA